MVYALWFQCEIWVSAVLAGALLMLFFTFNVTLSVQSSWRRSVLMHCDRVTYSLFYLIANWGMRLKDQTLYIFHNG